MRTDELRSALTDAIMLGEPPVCGGPGEVFARARRIRQRRWVTACTSAAAVIVVAALAVFNPSSSRVGTQDPAADLVSEVFGLTQAGTKALAAASAQTRSPRLTLVMSLLPPDVRVSEGTEQVTNSGPWIAGRLTATDTEGDTQVMYALVKSADLEPFLKCPGKQPGLVWECHVESVDGLTMTTSQMSSADGQGVIARCVNAQRSADTVVAICVANAFPMRGSHVGAVTRTEPFFTIDQLKPIATDPGWLS